MKFGSVSRVRLGGLAAPFWVSLTRETRPRRSRQQRRDAMIATHK